jgi:hypothetical protein
MDHPYERFNESGDEFIVINPATPRLLDNMLWNESWLCVIIEAGVTKSRFHEARIRGCWMDVIAKIRDSGKRCQIYVRRDGALKVKKELGEKGFLMHIVDDPMSPEEAETFLAEFRNQ